MFIASIKPNSYKLLPSQTQDFLKIMLTSFYLSNSVSFTAFSRINLNENQR